jgi:hypothetical protein
MLQLNLKMTNGNARRTVVGLAAVIATAGGLRAFVTGGSTASKTASTPVVTVVAQPALEIGQAGRDAEAQQAADCEYLAGTEGTDCSNFTSPWPVCTYSGVNAYKQVEWWCRGGFVVAGNRHVSDLIGIGPYGGIIVNSFGQPAVRHG